MVVIVGLGNSGKEYEKTRHNFGFRLIDALLSRYPHEKRSKKTLYEKFDCLIKDRASMLVKPRTYMNNSGLAVRDIVQKTGVSGESLLIVHDDLDLPFGSVRIKFSGGDGGHLGVRSIAENLQTEDFVRLRLGIGRPQPSVDATQYVLSAFTTEEESKIKNVLDDAQNAVEVIITDGFRNAMKQFNKKISQNEV